MQIEMKRMLGYTIFISDKIKFKRRQSNLTRDKEGHYIMFKGATKKKI